MTSARERSKSRVLPKWDWHVPEHLPGEVWRAHPWMYRVQVSSYGRIRHRLRSGAWSIVRPQLAPSARYPVANIWDESRGRHWPHRWHRLVAMAWHYCPPEENQPERLCVRHLNDDVWDFRPSNVAWGTYSQNWSDRRRNGLVGKSRKLKPDQVRAIRLGYDGSRTYAKRMAERYGVSGHTVREVLRGRTHKQIEPVKAKHYPMWRVGG